MSTDTEHSRLLDHCGTCREFRADFTDTGKDLAYGHCRVKPRTGSIHEKTYKCMDYVTHKDFLPPKPPKPEMPRPAPQSVVTQSHPRTGAVLDDDDDQDRGVQTGAIAKTNPPPRVDYRNHDDETRGPVRRIVGAVADTSAKVGSPQSDSLRATIVAAVADYMGLSAVPIAERWRGGTLILEPSNKDIQSKEVPLDSFFHKIVMIRNQLRVLESKINANEKLDDAEKVEMQQYITRCYGSLTTFNVLFAEKQDRFVGASADKDKG